MPCQTLPICRATWFLCVYRPNNIKIDVILPPEGTSYRTRSIELDHRKESLGQMPQARQKVAMVLVCVGDSFSLVELSSFTYFASRLRVPARSQNREIAGLQDFELTRACALALDRRGFSGKRSEVPAWRHPVLENCGTNLVFGKNTLYRTLTLENY